MVVHTNQTSLWNSLDFEMFLFLIVVSHICLCRQLSYLFLEYLICDYFIHVYHKKKKTKKKRIFIQGTQLIA